MFLLYGKQSYVFFLLLMSRPNPVKKSVLARLICISDRVGNAHGKEGGAQHRATFFNRSALSPCGHRSKAAMGLMKKKNQSLVLYEGETTAVSILHLSYRVLIQKS